MKEKTKDHKEVSGDPKQDLKNIRKSDPDYSIRILRNYVPQNRRLIDYIDSGEASKDYLYNQAKTVLNARIK